MLYESTVESTVKPERTGLNPYSNGICSMRTVQLELNLNISKSLNPYSNGICSMRKMQTGSKIVS